MRSWRYRGLRRRSRSSRVISRGFSIYRIFQRWNQVRRSHVGPTRYQGAPGGWRALVPRGHWVAPLQWVLVPIFFICSIKNLQKVSSNSKNFYFCTKNNTMAVLLKTALVRVSFIQVMQIRVQNKSKSVGKRRYDGDVSTPPSLNLCLSSSNSVDKLKVIKKNFYELFCSCVYIYA